MIFTNSPYIPEGYWQKLMNLYVCYLLFNCKGCCKTELCGTVASSEPLSPTTVHSLTWGIVGGITTNRKKPPVLGKNPVLCHFVHHKFHMDYCGIKPKPVSHGYTCLYDKNINLTQVAIQCHIHARPKAQCSGLNSLPRVITAQHSLYKQLQKMFCLTGKTDMIHFSDSDEDLFLN
jgi:hypothetical protein